MCSVCVCGEGREGGGREGGHTSIGISTRMTTVVSLKEKNCGE